MSDTPLTNERLRIALEKSCHCIKTMIDLKNEYNNLLENDEIHNMSDMDIQKYKRKLERVLQRNISNIDVYSKELFILLFYIEDIILEKDELPQ